MRTKPVNTIECDAMTTTAPENERGAGFPPFAGDPRTGWPVAHGGLARRPATGRRPDGWFTPHNKQVLRTLLSADTRCVVELGSYLGLSTRFILEHAPNALVYAVDLWDNAFLLSDEGLGKNYNRTGERVLPFELCA